MKGFPLNKYLDRTCLLLFGEAYWEAHFACDAGHYTLL